MAQIEGSFVGAVSQPNGGWQLQGQVEHAASRAGEEYEQSISNWTSFFTVNPESWKEDTRFFQEAIGVSANVIAQVPITRP